MRRFVKIFVLAVVIIAPSVQSQSTQSASPALIPRPTQMELMPGVFTLAPHTALIVGAGAEHEALMLEQFLAPATGVTFDRAKTPDLHVSTITLEVSEPTPPSQTIPEGAVDEHYTVRVTPSAVALSARTPAGLLDAIQTFRQLLPAAAFSSKPRVGIAWTVPCLSIEDAPRFVYRGLMLDCSRHFWPKEFVLRYIDLMSLHKFNTFHWHLTDDQGWRIEIRKYPRLTEIGAWRSQTVVGHPERYGPNRYDGIPHGGYYTQADIREVVAYAAERHITVMPEIEMPGHSRAAVAAYPQLGLEDEFTEPATGWGQHGTLNTNDATVQFYEDVLTEVMELFPSKFIHCGGDEVVLKDWKNNPAMREKMRLLPTTNPADLQARFMEQIDAFLTSKGRRMVGWDEILDGHLAPGATVMSWRGTKGGIAAANLGHDVIMTPGKYCYLDHYQSSDHVREPDAIGGYLPLNEVYRFDPIPPKFSTEQASHILGGQGNVWAEYLPTTAQVEYMVYPRACAMAEVLWSPPKGDFPDFYGRLQTHLQRLGLKSVNFRRLDANSTTQPSTREAEDM